MMDFDEITERFKPPPYLTCAVCLEVFKDPRLLPCSHTICQRCVIGISQHSEPERRYATTGDPRDVVRCPVCRYKIQKDKIFKLPCNRAIEDVICDWTLQMKKDRAEWIKSKISVCVDHGEEAKVWCSDCHTNICPMCTTDPELMEAPASQSGHSHSHQWQYIEDFVSFCDKRSHLLNDLLGAFPQMNELGTVISKLTEEESNVLSVYHNFLSDIEGLELQIYNMLALKFSAVIADLNLKLQEPLQYIRSQRNSAVELLVKAGNHYSHAMESNNDIPVTTKDEILNSKDTEYLLTKTIEKTERERGIFKINVSNVIKKVEKLKGEIGSYSLYREQGEEDTSSAREANANTEHVNAMNYTIGYMTELMRTNRELAIPLQRTIQASDAAISRSLRELLESSPPQPSFTVGTSSTRSSSGRQNSSGNNHRHLPRSIRGRSSSSSNSSSRSRHSTQQRSSSGGDRQTMVSESRPPLPPITTTVQSGPVQQQQAITRQGTGTNPAQSNPASVSVNAAAQHGNAPVPALIQNIHAPLQQMQNPAFVQNLNVPVQPVARPGPAVVPVRPSLVQTVTAPVQHVPISTLIHPTSTAINNVAGIPLLHHPRPHSAGGAPFLLPHGVFSLQPPPHTRPTSQNLVVIPTSEPIVMPTPDSMHVRSSRPASTLSSTQVTSAPSATSQSPAAPPQASPSVPRRQPTPAPFNSYQSLLRDGEQDNNGTFNFYVMESNGYEQVVSADPAVPVPVELVLNPESDLSPEGSSNLSPEGSSNMQADEEDMFFE